MNEPAPTAPLRDVWRVFRERRRLLVGTGFVMLLVVGALGAQEPRLATARAMVQLTTGAPEANYFGLRPSRPTQRPAQRSQQAARSLLSQDSVALDALERLRRSGGTKLPRSLSAVGTGPLGQVAIFATDPAEEVAKDGADAFAGAIAAAYARQERRVLQNALDQVRGELRALEVNPIDPFLFSQRYKLQTSAARLTALRDASQAAQVIERAKITEGATQPQIAGPFFFAFTIVLVLVVLLDRLNPRPRAASRLAAAGGLQLLASLPRRERRTTESAEHLRAILRSHEALPERPCILLVGIDDAEEARQLASRLVPDAGGTAVVDLDPQAPVRDDVVLAVATGRRSAAEVVGALEPDGGAVRVGPPAPHALSDAAFDEAVGQVLEALRRQCEQVVLVEPSPLMRSLPLRHGPLCDGVILVGGSGRTDVRDVRRATEQLERLGAQVLGLVVLGAPDAEPVPHSPRRTGRLPRPRIALPWSRS